MKIMTRAQIGWSLVGVAIVVYFAYSWRARNSLESGIPVSPMVKAQSNLNKPKPTVAKPARVVLKDFKNASPDGSQFIITYTLTNPGDEAAVDIEVHVHPWVGGDYNPDRNGEQVNPADPINKIGKDDFIPRLEPKQSVTRSLQFNQAYGYLSSVLPHGFTFTFKPASTPH
jgi:hypothetical protein